MGRMTVRKTKEMDYAVFVNLFEMPYPIYDYDRQIWLQCYCRNDAYITASAIESVTCFSYDLIKLIVHYTVLIRATLFDTSGRAVDFYLATLADAVSL